MKAFVLRSMIATSILLPALSAFGAPVAAGGSARVCRDFFEGPALRPNAHLEDGIGVFATREGERIAVKMTGHAKAETVVIFLAGIDKDLKQWDYTRQRLAKDAEPRLYVQVDLLAQGHTAEMTRFKSHVSYREQLRVLNELIEKNGWAGRRIVLAGHSYGGGIAARFAADHPGLVSDVILFSPFVDNLEVHQPGVGPMMSVAQKMSAAMGFGGLYDLNVNVGSQMATLATWPTYAFFNSRMGRIWSVLALTNGIRDLGMTNAVQKLGQQGDAQVKPTKVHLAISMMDEMVPPLAQMQLWRNVGSENRGNYVNWISTHDSVSYWPDHVAGFIRRAL